MIIIYTGTYCRCPQLICTVPLKNQGVAGAMRGLRFKSVVFAAQPNGEKVFNRSHPAGRCAPIVCVEGKNRKNADQEPRKAKNPLFSVRRGFV